HFLHLFSHQSKLRCACRINLLFVTEGDRFEGQKRFAGAVHRFDLLLEALRGSRDAELTASIYNDGCSCDCNATDPLDKGHGLYPSNTNGVGLCRYSRVANVNVIASDGEITSRVC